VEEEERQRFWRIYGGAFAMRHGRKKNAFGLKSLLSYAESTFVFRQSYPDITPSVL